ncbi:competence type IV pilus ATPase ComGA [Alkalihalobacillus sp. MEB130]|uniref:competence type IV pilus ATPase ComGA n=1 Tax=Alkalihalobacillus sp. MEB130 TaxID=2976704 RepID=UPI0028E03FA8|nr:competence type IV pilus ATPase ComGA [Alkalihalobacillus sp. MEB130]MDT8862763.1 competence type IV pilus ATPase ComGA [Alkalihalobacillus sp. MEB130]
MYEVELYSKQMINEAIRRKMTDLHFIPQEEHFLLMYRYNGDLQMWRQMPMKLSERLISHFKYRSGMDIGERRKPQSSSMTYQVSTSTTYSLRLSTLPSKNKESLAIRILPDFSLQSFSSLSILRTQVKTLETITKLSHGLCLVSGPTGSGKTTTLYSIIEHILHKKEKAVITIEDPVERNIPKAIQVEVNSKTGMTFDSALKASLRHDPDVILLGEIRDEETAKIAVRAALTGHLVLATVHADNCFSALMRLREFGVSQLDLSQCCKMILSQRLLKTKCPYCTGSCMPVCSRVRLMSRAALYEFAIGGKLEQMLCGVRGKNDSFLQEAKKAWSLGYIEEEEVLRFVRPF